MSVIVTRVSIPFCLPRRFFSTGLGRVLFVLSGVAMSAETAQAILDRSAGTYAGLRSWTVELTTRNLDVMLMSTPVEDEPKCVVRSSKSQQISLKLCILQNEWMATVRDGIEVKEGGSDSERALPNGYFVLMRMAGENRQSVFGPQGVSFQSIASDSGIGLLREKISTIWEDDVLLPLILGEKNGSAAASFDLKQPELASEEGGVYRITARNTKGRPVEVWIDKSSHFVVRSLVYFRPQVPGPEQQVGSSPFVTLRESRYSQSLNPNLSSKDFNLSLPSRLPPFDPEGLGFGGAVELVKHAGLRTTADLSFTDEHFQAMVKVAGGEKAASGFMVNIKGGDFVLTNLSTLLGGNRLVISDASGRDLPVTEAFGAVGADIALLRINPKPGGLKLAANVADAVKQEDRIGLLKFWTEGAQPQPNYGYVRTITLRTVDFGYDLDPESRGGPIMGFSTYEVVGVVTNFETRRLLPRGANVNTGILPRFSVTESRWFGTRIDTISKWEPINLTRFRAQHEIITKFRATTDMFLAFVEFNLGKIGPGERIAKLVSEFKAQAVTFKNNKPEVARLRKDLIYALRTMAEADVYAFERGDYFNYFLTTSNWTDSIPAQLEYRRAVIEVLKQYETNPEAYLGRLGL
jgi:hypothetical protein